MNFIDRISIVQDFDHNYARITHSSATTSVVRNCTRPFRRGGLARDPTNEPSYDGHPPISRH